MCESRSITSRNPDCRRAHYLHTPTVPRVAQQRRALMKRRRRDHGRLLGRGRQQITECIASLGFAGSRTMSGVTVSKR